MRCPKCTSIEDKVIDSRISKEGSSIRRRRECLECSHRYSTTEFIVREGIVVIKRDGRREDFDREKLVRSAQAACQKRPVDAEQISMLIEDVIDALEAQYDTDIPSRAIGDAVMQRLRKIDEVAYVRFASVYKEFRDVSEFMHEINGLDKKVPSHD
ncbi:transcriptional regulator NrdR [Rariglobus hedericola]|uniref:Transcriptional repressor NrdR n=1 Tax=Rariglobus hedericola TaxID=2597822 RepID=A0A556QKV2_9BACT|nr:transcriptional regulator NrdR [Rariglobus hedericola]TSJ77285.1 transcriptional repressor NrdR [Rariglobus hedericola]